MAAPSSSLNVIALISGGKDSMFSMLHCLANGHQIVALANLHPPERREEKAYGETRESRDPSRSSSTKEPTIWDDDLDSYMYQTVGHHLIPLFAEALELPLFRQEIIGEAFDRSMIYQTVANQVKNLVNYSTTAQTRQGVDETESLLSLLHIIVKAHPEANAVSSGAILSTYQRTRIENVATRLGLLPLSFLWQYPVLPPPNPSQLLHDMRQAGLDVRIIKVASGGLDESLLWAKLLDVPTLNKVERAVRRFGGSVLGEGGEYETMVLNGPTDIWKKRIDISSVNMQTSAESAADVSAWLTFKKSSGRVVANIDGENRVSLKDLVRIPAVWDREFGILLAKTDEREIAGAAVFEGLSEDTTSAEDLHYEFVLSTVPGSPHAGALHAVSNLTGPNNGTTPWEQMVGINHQIRTTLAEMGCATDSIVFSTILLRSMSDFAVVNKAYSQMFNRPSPPARVTVACPLPVGIHVVVSILIRSSGACSALHVQSRSYWAPANIGPYSQAIGVPLNGAETDRLTFIAGQIPLVPATMEKLEPQFHDEAISLLATFRQRCCLAAQHLWRIGREMKVDFWAGGVAFVTGKSMLQERAHEAWNVWRELHQPNLWEQLDEDDTFDIWDKRHGKESVIAIEQEEERHLPNFDKLSMGDDPAAATNLVPGFLAVQVKGLPKECEIEWQGLGVSIMRATVLKDLFQNMIVTSLFIPSTRTYVSFVEFPVVPGAKDYLRNYLWNAMEWARGKAFADSEVLCTLYVPGTSMTPDVLDMAVQVVPCHAVWGQDGKELAGGLVMLINPHLAS